MKKIIIGFVCFVLFATTSFGQGDIQSEKIGLSAGGNTTPQERIHIKGDDDRILFEGESTGIDFIKPNAQFPFAFIGLNTTSNGNLNDIQIKDISGLGDIEMFTDNNIRMRISNNNFVDFFSPTEINHSADFCSPNLNLHQYDDEFSILSFSNGGFPNNRFYIAGDPSTTGNDPAQLKFQWGTVVDCKPIDYLTIDATNERVISEQLFEVRGDLFEITSAIHDDQKLLGTSRQIKIYDEDGIELVQLGDSGAGANDEGTIWLRSKDGGAQQNGVYLHADRSNGGEMTLYTGDGLQRAILKADGGVGDYGRLFLEGVSQTETFTDATAAHLIELSNDKDNISTFDDESFFIGLWEDHSNIQGANFFEETISFSFTTGGAEPTNSDIISTIDQYGNYNKISDRRLKQDIESLENVLSKVNDLNPVTYRYKSDENSRLQLGFIAQEIKELFPLVVKGDAENSDEFMMVNYESIIPILTKAIQEQQELINQQNNELATYRSELDELRGMVSEIRSAMDQEHKKSVRALDTEK